MPGSPAIAPAYTSHVTTRRSRDRHAPQHPGPQAGADLVEFDVQLTSDGQVVVLHDATVDRTTDGRGRVGQITLAQVRALSAGYPGRFGDAHRGERVPTLAEALGLLKDRARVMVEIKPESVGDDAEGGIEARTVAELSATCSTSVIIRRKAGNCA